jgi:predicted enzyme related to lactoylglutathione lyase
MTTSAAFRLSSIGQIALTVTDVDRAIAFYRDVLGLPHLFTVPRMAFFDCAGVRLLLGLPEPDEERRPGAIVYFRVEDIEAAAAVLRARGVRFEQEPAIVARMPDHELWMAQFRDPDGNALELMCERR